MKIFVRLRKRRKEEFQFFMHDFVDACVEHGFETKPDVLPSYRWHLRAVCRDILWLGYRLIGKLMPGILRRKHALLVTANGNTIRDSVFPYYGCCEIVPMLWDVWPNSWGIMLEMLRELRQNCYSYVGLPFRILRKFFGIVFGNKYEDYCNFMLKNYIDKNGSIPCIYPNWDHSARSGKMATIFRNADPNIWGRLCKGIFESCKQKPSEENLIIIKSWNEWGEGNYLESDRRYKRGYIEELRAALDSK